MLAASQATPAHPAQSLHHPRVSAGPWAYRGAGGALGRASRWRGGGSILVETISRPSPTRALTTCDWGWTAQAESRTATRCSWRMARGAGWPRVDPPGGAGVRAEVKLAVLGHDPGSPSYSEGRSWRDVSWPSEAGPPVVAVPPPWTTIHLFLRETRCARPGIELDERRHLPRQPPFRSRTTSNVILPLGVEQSARSSIAIDYPREAELLRETSAWGCRFLRLCLAGQMLAPHSAPKCDGCRAESSPWPESGLLSASAGDPCSPGRARRHATLPLAQTQFRLLRRRRADAAGSAPAVEGLRHGECGGAHRSPETRRGDLRALVRRRPAVNSGRRA